MFHKDVQKHPKSKISLIIFFVTSMLVEIQGENKRKQEEKYEEK